MTVPSLPVDVLDAALRAFAEALTDELPVPAAAAAARKAVREKSDYDERAMADLAAGITVVVPQRSLGVPA
jgi:hypothetical protein